MEEVTNLLKEKKGKKRDYGFKRHLGHSDQGYLDREAEMVGAEHGAHPGEGEMTPEDRARMAAGARAADLRRKKAAKRPGNRVTEDTFDEERDHDRHDEEHLERIRDEINRHIDDLRDQYHRSDRREDERDDD